MGKVPTYIQFHSDLTEASAILDNMIGSGGTICQKGIKYKCFDKTYKSKRRLKRSNKISVAFNSPKGVKQFPGELAFHFAWSYLDFDDRVCLCIAAPVMILYAKLRWEASSLTKSIIKSIVAPLDHTFSTTTISDTRSNHLAQLLLLCDFEVGKLIRLLQGMYTGDFLDFPEIDKTLHKLCDISVTPGQPKHNFDLI